MTKYAGRNLKEIWTESYRWCCCGFAFPSLSLIAAHPVWGLLRGFSHLKGSFTLAHVGEWGLCKITWVEKQGDPYQILSHSGSTGITNDINGQKLTQYLQRHSSVPAWYKSLYPLNSLKSQDSPCFPAGPSGSIQRDQSRKQWKGAEQADTGSHTSEVQLEVIPLSKVQFSYMSKVPAALSSNQ